MSDPAYEAMSKAKRQVDGGNTEGAVQTLESYLESDPHNTKPRLLLANILYYDMNDGEYGDIQMDIILDLEPDNIEALKASVTVLSKDKKNNKVVNERFLKILETAPDSETYAAYARFLRIQKLDFQSSAKYYEKAISSNPNKYEYHQNYAVLLLNDIKDFQKAKHELEEVLRLNPGNISARTNYDLLIKKKFNSDGTLKKKRLSFSR